MKIWILDTKQIKREGGARFYKDICPTITSRDYKGPLLVMYEYKDSERRNNG